MKAEEFFKEWSSVTRIFKKEEQLGITYDQVIELMEAYHQSRLNVSDQEIDEAFNKSPSNRIHPDRFRAEGAKWMRNLLKQ